MDSTNNMCSHQNQQTSYGENFTPPEPEDFLQPEFFAEPTEPTKYNADTYNIQRDPKHLSSFVDIMIRQSSADIQTGPSEDIEEEQEHEPQQLLLGALNDNDFERFSSLLKMPGVDPKFKQGKPHYTACIEVACRLDWGGKFVKTLLDHGVKPNVNEIHQEPIHYAAKYGNPEALEVLLQNKKTKINIVDSAGRTALHHAVSYSKEGKDAQYERCIELLLKRPDFALNLPNNNGYTAVYEAANFSNKTAVEIILKYRKDDVDLDSYRTKGRTARQCILSKYPELGALLPKYRIKYKSLDLHNQLLQALQNREQKIFHKILCLVDEDGKARVNPNYHYGRPHYSTCLEVGCREKDCAEFVKELLTAGADPNLVNPTTKETALHLAIKTRNIPVLKVLLKHRRTNIKAVHDEVTQLIAEHDKQIDIEETAQDNEETEQYKDDMQGLKTVFLRRKSEIRKAICKKYPDLGTTKPQHTNEHRSQLAQTLFQHLYEGKCEDFKKEFSEECKDIDDGNYTLLQYATLHSLVDIVRLLLENGANPNLTTEYEKRPPIIIACTKKDHEIMELLLGPLTRNKLDVNVTDAKGNTALHHASRTVYLECVVELMRRGADITHKNVFDKPPLPAKSVEYFLDNSLQTDKFPEEEEYKIIFDYRFLTAHKEKGTQPDLPKKCYKPLTQDPESGCENDKPPKNLIPEMDFLFYISSSKEHRKLMQHPIITSFLHMKWQRVKLYFYINILLYVTFGILLNACILLKIADSTTNAGETLTTSNDTETSQSTSTGIRFHAAWVLTLFLLLYFTVGELLQLALSPKVYLKNFENVLDISIICFTGYILFRSEWHETVVVITIILSWTKLILLTGRLPKLSTNIEMLKTVSRNYFRLLITYMSLLIAFAFSFYSLLHKNATYSSIKYDDKENEYFFMNPLMSVTKTFVMMMGEFDAGSMASKMANSPTCFCLFTLFVFIIAMVPLNLLTGLAVSDTQASKCKAKETSLVSRIRLIHKIESTLLQWHTFLEKWCNYTLPRCFMNLHKSKMKNISLFPDTSYNRKIHVLPNKGPNIVFEHNERNESNGEGEGEFDSGHATKAYVWSRVRTQRIYNRGSEQNTSCRMPLRIIGEAIGIVSNREPESEANNMKANFSQIQEVLEENESMLSKIQNKMEVNHKLLENYQQKFTDIERKLEHDKIQSKNKGFKKMKHKANMSHNMQNTPDEKCSHTDDANQETKVMFNQILKMLQDMKGSNN